MRAQNGCVGALGVGTMLLMSILWVDACRGATVTFSGLTEANFVPVPTPYAEAGFEVNLGPGWEHGQLFGGPIPSIFSTAASASIDVVGKATGLFTFAGVDLADAYQDVGHTRPGYQIDGFLGGATQFTATGSVGFGFHTIAGPAPSQVLDLLRITMFKNGTSSYNIDNVEVNAARPVAVPLPSAVSLAMCAAPGLLGAHWLRRRKLA